MRAARVPAPADPPSWLRETVGHFASIMGDVHPRAASCVMTTRQAAMDVESAGRVGSNEPVYCVALHGRFVTTHARIPPGSTFDPRGSVLTLTVNVETRTIMDFGIGDRLPDLAKLGAVQDFPGGV